MHIDLQSLLLEEFTAISVTDLLVTVAAACLLGILIAVVYRITYSGVLFSMQFALGLVLLSMITGVVILAISANLVLSLGMVGALSIVRFRTAVKDPMDTIFMFWALVTGILTGAGFLLIAALATAVIGALFLLLCLLTRKRGAPGAYLLVIRYEEGCKTKLMPAVSALPAYRVKSQSAGDGYEELVLELTLRPKQMRHIDELRALDCVIGVNLVACGQGV